MYQEILTKLPKSYVLVIAEKPRAAEKIALALGGRNARKIYINKVPIWIVRWMGRDLVIASAAGHLYTLHTDHGGYPVFEYRWVPRYLVDRDAYHTKRFLEVLKLLSKKAVEYVNACDYDIEGSLIGYMIIKNLGDERKAKRAKFSSLTPQDIVKAFVNLQPLDYEMIEAGSCRHELDWLWGINISRALMDIYREAFGKDRVLSAGRVQTPTLMYAVSLVLERRLHVPEPLFYPIIKVEIGGRIYTLENLDEPFETASAAKRYVELLKSRPYVKVVDVERKYEIVEPPYPFSLPDLQDEAYRIYGISPYRTQQIAEDLYLEALISYPRTNSQKLPPALDVRSILEGLKRIPTYRTLVERLYIETKGVFRPHNGPKEDPAHPAIHPTGEVPTKPLPPSHRKIFDLVVRRFLATFSKPARILRIRIVFEASGRRYQLQGLKIVDEGWYRYYPYSKPEEVEIPLDVKVGQIFKIVSTKIRIVYTQPPPRPSRYGLLKWMESVEIGTEATRAEIIETLYRRGYLYTRGRTTEVSDLGIAVAYTLSRYVPDLTSPDLTRKFEKYLEMIRRRQLRCYTVLEEAKKVLIKYIEMIKRLKKQIASELFNYIESSNVQPRCVICRRRAVDVELGLCVFHLEAYRRLKEKYTRWKESGYSWEEYLKKLLSLRSTGSYVKEVCRYLLGTLSKAKDADRGYLHRYGKR